MSRAIGSSSNCSNLKSKTGTDTDATDETCDYESAVLKLQSLVSNADVLAAKRADKGNRGLRQMAHISNINKFILRSGLKKEDVDNLSMIHVSGTKGKGSTCAFCERILHSKGYKTGLFSSPHLIEVRERIRINGRPVSKELYAFHFWKVYNRLKETQMEKEKDEGLPAYFAFNMILSLHIFLAEAVDVVIMEVGIGGQYDSTNFIRVPSVCGITSLGYDHTSILGHTLEEIAWNKAGIMKTGCPAFVVQQASSAMNVILNRARERQSPLYIASSIDRGILEKEKINLGISGNKQRDNASLAVQLADMWEKRHNKAPMEPMACNMSAESSVEEIPVLEISHMDSSTAKGLSTCVWPGRAQTVKRHQVTYYLDGAHTRESIQVCSQWFKEKADEEEESIEGKVVRVLIFNVTGDRNAGPLLEYLKDCCFDAAGFSTNTVSTVESFNKKDQVNPMYTSKAMMEKTEENRISWENLNRSFIHSSTGEVVSSSGANLSSSTSGSDPSSADVLKKRKVDVCLGQGLGQSVSPDLTSNTLANDKVMESFSRRFSSGTSSNGHSTTSTVKTGNFDDNDIDNHNNNNIDLTKDSMVTSHTCLSQNCSSVCDLDSTKDNVGPEGQGEVMGTDTSHTFPCLLQALTWATQGKDPSVTNKDPNAHLPPVPAALKDADHIQVLITGSLHLVGGVLAVVTPDMNN